MPGRVDYLKRHAPYIKPAPILDGQVDFNRINSFGGRHNHFIRIAHHPGVIRMSHDQRTRERLELRHLAYVIPVPMSRDNELKIYSYLSYPAKEVLGCSERNVNNYPFE